jgi:hypothetical protein
MIQKLFNNKKIKIMKKLELNQMENLEGGGRCVNTLTSGAYPSYTTQEACIICSGLSGAVAGSLGGPGAALAGWAGGLIWGMFDC